MVFFGLLVIFALTDLIERQSSKSPCVRFWRLSRLLWDRSRFCTATRSEKENDQILRGEKRTKYKVSISWIHNHLKDQEESKAFWLLPRNLRNLKQLTCKSSRCNVSQVVVAEIEGDKLAKVLECVDADVVDQVVRQAEVRNDRESTEGVLC